jgi:solute carrier family 15 oligopeptide transporter 1
MSEKEKVDDVDSNPDSEEALAKPTTKQRYPRSVFFIIGNEFCERFSYYGMKNVLALYFTNVLLFSEDRATEYYHIFSMLCYFTPIIGAYIADTLMGKYKTIFYISFIYAAGNIVLSLASYFEDKWVTLIGLLLIALGTGGIKPCVSAFGADQFNKGQEHHLQRFFSFFYIAINAGSLISNIVTPILRKDVNCSVRSDCFPLAFGVPSVLMLAAIAFFIVGRYVTHYKMVPPKKKNIVVTVICCVFYSLWKKITKIFSSEKSRDHWLDYGDDKYDVNT